MDHVAYKVFNLHFSIRCGTYITHICTQISSLSVSPSKFIMFTPQAEALSSAHSCLYRRCLRSQQNSSPEHPWSGGLSTQGVGRTLRHDSDTRLKSRGELGGPPIFRQSNHTSERDTTLLPKTLRQCVYGSSHL